MNKERITWFLVFLAPILNICTSIFYNWKIFIGEGHPNATSWGIWVILTILNFTTYKVMSGDWIKSIFPTISSITCLATFVIASQTGHFAVDNPYDPILLLLGALTAVVWWITRSSSHAQKILQVSLTIGFISTAVGVVNHTGVENLAAWISWTIVFLIQTAVVFLRWEGKWMDAVYPINMVVCHGVVTILILCS